MLTCFAKFFRFGTLVILLYSHIVLTESLSLNILLNVFEYCAIHIYNYRDLTLSPWNNPLILHAKIPFQIEPEIQTLEIIRAVQCQAAIYILPTNADKKVPGKGRNNAGRHYSSRIPRRRTNIRYDVLVDDPKRQSTKIWATTYSIFLYQGSVTSFGLITEIDGSLSKLSFKLEIINIFKVSYKKPFVTASMSLKQILWNHQLYQAVMYIHDPKKNTDVQWTLNMQSDGMKNDYQNFLHQLSLNTERVKTMFKMNLASPAYAKLLQPTKLSEEGMENFLFAFTLLGADVNLTKPSNVRKIPEHMINPRITFNVPQGTEMMNQKPRGSAYVSCSTAGGPRYHEYSFLEAVMVLISVFEIRIYFALIATYVAPPIILGLLYHFLLKKRIKKEHRVSWHPFSWGIRALIWQAGDRKFNSSRFGWTTFMVVPWLLVAIVITNVLQKHVLSVTGTGGRLTYPRNVLEIQYHSGITLVTDNERLAMDLNSYLYADSFEDIAYQVGRNRSITYISWADRVTTVAKLIGHRCPNSWQPVKFGRVHYWNLRFVSRYVGTALRSEMRGWVIEKLVGSSILYKLGVLDMESGIFGKWRESLERLNEYKPIFDHVGRWIVRINMSMNIKYLFYFGATGDVVALVIWIAEWVFFKAYTQTRRKSKKKMDDVSKALVVEQLGKSNDLKGGSINSGGGIDEEILNQAVLLVTEQRRSSLLVGQMLNNDLMEDENEKASTVVDEAFVEEKVREGENIEIRTEVEGIVEDEDRADKLEIQENVDIQDNCSSVTVLLEEIEGNQDAVKLEGLVDVQTSFDGGLAVEKNGSTEITIGVPKSESRVSFADPLESIIEPKFELGDEDMLNNPT